MRNLEGKGGKVKRCVVTHVVISVLLPIRPTRALPALVTGGECRPRFVSCFTQAFSSLLSTSSTSPFRFEEGKIPVLFRATYDAKKVKLI